MNSQLVWYVARAGGIVAWSLVAASVLWGLALSTKVLGKRPRPAWLLDLHRFLGGAALVFTGIHIVTIMLDTYVHFGITDVLVPLASHWHPVAVSWGVVALYLLVAIQVTSQLRARISKRLWRSTHYASFPLFLLTTIHALTAGSDRTSPALRGAMLLVTIAVALLTWVRVRGERAPSTPPTLEPYAMPRYPPYV